MERDDDRGGGEPGCLTVGPAPAVPGVRQTPGHGDEVTHKLIESVLPPAWRDFLFCFGVRVENPIRILQ